MWATLVLAMLFASGLAKTDVNLREGAELIGTPAPPLKLQNWINTQPIDIADLRGKVVLVRWWTDTCELCAATAPALRQLDKEYGAQGFVVIGVFHPKPAGDWSVERMRRAAEKFQFTFPVALDGDWSALKRWWLDGGDRSFTSASFLIDKHGIIRYVHPGGEFHPYNGAPGHETCEADYRTIERTIAELLAEK
jgi:peroxiredoxin